MQALVLLLIGAAVLRASAGDLYLRYVKPGLRPLLVLGGVLLVVTAAMSLWHDLRSRTDDGAPGGHAHTHGSRVAWLLIAPVLGILLIAPPALGSYAATHDGSVVQVPTVLRPLPAGDPVHLRISDYAGRAAYAHGAGLTGHLIRLTGFVYTDGQGRPYLARMVLTCCAADAGPVKVGLGGQLPAGLTPDTWVEVTGRYDPTTRTDAINGAVIPYLDVTAVRRIATPHDTYE
nr:TIGR03943 family protein [Planosporangium thailandense]